MVGWLVGWLLLLLLVGVVVVVVVVVVIVVVVSRCCFPLYCLVVFGGVFIFKDCQLEGMATWSSGPPG